MEIIFTANLPQSQNHANFELAYPCLLVFSLHWKQVGKFSKKVCLQKAWTYTGFLQNSSPCGWLFTSGQPENTKLTFQNPPNCHTTRLPEVSNPRGPNDQKKSRSRSKFSISIEFFDLARKFQSRCLDFTTKSRATVGGSLENFILDDRNLDFFWSLGPLGLFCYFLQENSMPINSLFFGGILVFSNFFDLWALWDGNNFGRNGNDSWFETTWGAIPAGVASLAKLTLLLVSRNELRGAIPDAVMSLARLSTP